MKIETFSKDRFAQSKTLKNVESKYAGKNGTEGGVTVIGGSKLFHGAPLLALKAASRIVSMVYFASPDEDKEVADKIKSSLLNFIWVPFEDAGSYVSKSDVILIGPGMMRSHVSEHGFVCDDEGEKTRRLCLNLFKNYPESRWVVDGGALQVVSLADLPKGAVISPNRKEFSMLFDQDLEKDYERRAKQIFSLSKKYGLTVLTKDEVSMVSDGNTVVRIEGGNEGLVKGGVGDVIAGILTGFLAKDSPIFSAAAASFLSKKAAEKLAEKRGLMFNADDLVDMVPVVYGEIMQGE